MSTYDPYSKYASSTDISTSFIVEDWKCELVDPKHPALHTVASIDPFSGDVNWTDREKEMIELMHQNLGIGLAAPQVGSSYRMFVMHHSIMGDIGIYKPEILEKSEETAHIEEGCLTFPLLYMHITRPQKIKVRYYKNNGETQVETWMDGMDARCFLHEYDHLQGELFLDLVSELKFRRAHEKREKLFKKLQRRVRNG